jgi:5-methylcytosine-specific restriction endonuclease McrA
MIKLTKRMPRLKLPLREYATLRTRALERDGWRCQFCGSSNNLQVHHLKSRSKLGDDALQNLISLCVTCHGKQHHDAD